MREFFRRIWAHPGLGTIVLSGSLTWFFCILVEAVYLYNGVRLHIIPIIVLVLASVAHWRAAMNYLHGPLPFFSRSLPLILMQFAMILVFILLLLQAALPIW